MGLPCKLELFLDLIMITLEIFKDTIDFLEMAGVQNATFNILTPFPGTPLFRKMENRRPYINARLEQL